MIRIIKTHCLKEIVKQIVIKKTNRRLVLFTKGGGCNPLALTDSLLCCRLVLSPTGNFLSTSGKKVTKETPQGTDGSLTSYVLRTRTHSTSQKSIAVGSYFWGVVGPLSCKSYSERQDEMLH